MFRTTYYRLVTHISFNYYNNTRPTTKREFYVRKDIQDIYLNSTAILLIIDFTFKYVGSKVLKKIYNSIKYLII